MALWRTSAGAILRAIGGAIWRCAVCPCVAGCVDVPTLDAVFSGVGNNCPTCEPGRLITGISNDLEGLIVLGQDGGDPTRWTAEIEDGWTYDQYSEEDCLGEPTPQTVPLIVAVVCVDGIYTIGAGDGTTEIFSGSGALGESIANAKDCGGFVTLSA